MRKAAPTLLVLLLAASVPAGAADQTILMKDGSFSPKYDTSTMGTRLVFKNTGAAPHNTKLWGSVMPSWNSGQMTSGETWTKVIRYAGQYNYYCTYHSSGPGNEMWGRVNIPVRVSATSGSTSTSFVVRVATVDAPSGWVYDVIRRKGSGSWERWKYGTRNDIHTFRAGSLGPGTYYFKSKLRRTANNAATAYSSAAKITVS